ncbi:iron reductase domain protein [Zopfia rhizophila CBS 207.26]|uniref:Iron reductase domain protein n=1 Tax=Zopfia rhizophila CBS 207.26 TaxID=1314779 RepID=A0A6A6DXU2_9PEZI|nr:iron reductase domain protein [Zopfia rhizophila CBS 207.26]
MRSMRKTIVASGLLAFVSGASAQVASVCPTTDVCFKLNIPDSTASSGNGDVFFQLSAPSSYEWVALGQGSSMSGSNIFVAYVSSDGNNVTISPRLGTGHTMPRFNSDAQVTLLEGSGVSNGKMIANVRCSNCNSWSGGTADFTAGNGNWIYGVKNSGGPKRSNDQSANIAQHSNEDSFRWDYADAKGGNSVNPLVNAAPSGTASNTGTVSCVPRPTGAASGSAGASPTATQTSDDDDDSRTGRPDWATGSPSEWRSNWPTAAPTGYRGPPGKRNDNVNYCDENSNSNNGFTPLSSSRSASNRTKMLTAHGVLAALAFVIFFPAGAIAIRLASFPGVVWFHAAFQAFAYLVYIAAFGLGVYIANDLQLLDNYHPIIGIVVFVCLFFQPIFGLLHHSLFKKYQSRTFWSYIHLWLGRAIITLGIINGGLGFKLANTMGMGSRSGMIAYSVVAGIVWLAMVATAILGESRRRKAGPTDRPPKYTESPRSEMTQGDIPAPPNGHYAPK